MAVMDILSNGLRSLTGAVEKAYLEFEDERIRTEDITVTEVQARAAGLPPGLANAAALANQAAAAASSAASLVGSLGVITDVVDMLFSTKKKYEVKFNPSEITFQAKGGEGKLIQKMNFAAEGKVSAKYATMQTHIVMNVPLIFDDYERTDAFMMEKFSDPTALARTAVTSVINAITGDTYSVRPQVEGFLGALHNEKTRKVTFSWGKMSYKGILSGVDAEYTMFNMEGHPIRAVVNLSIVLVDEKVKDNEMGVWKTSYEKAFGVNSSLFDTISDGVSKAGNLVNLKL